MKPLNIGLCGFGGQGIILTSVILGTAQVTKKNRHVVQMQSYGSEARGGQCQAELIISDKPIHSPMAEKKDILIAMFQSALHVYFPTLKEDGILIIDPHLVKEVPRTKARVIEVNATEIATKLGNRVAANMVVLGFIQESTRLMEREDLMDIVKESVPEKFLALNIKAVDAGRKIAEDQKISVEV